MEIFHCIRCGAQGAWGDFVKDKAVCLPCERLRRAIWREKNRARLAEVGPRCDGTKTCSKCGTEKPRLEFQKHTGTVDGRHSWCRACTYAATKAQRSEGIGREKKLACQKRGRAKMTPEQQQRERERLNAVTARQREKKLAALAADHRAHVEAFRAAKEAAEADRKRLLKELRAARPANIPPNAGPNRIKKLRRKHAVRRATPPWASKKETAAVYAAARLLSDALGDDLVVDHIVPLRSPLVSGLPWHGNLQILPRGYNSSKGNLTWPDKP